MKCLKLTSFIQILINSKSLILLFLEKLLALYPFIRSNTKFFWSPFTVFMLILFVTNFFKSMYGALYLFGKLKPSKKFSWDKFLYSISFFLVASRFSSFFTKALKNVGYDLINSSGPSFNSTRLLVPSSLNLFLSSVAFSSSLFLPLIFSSLLKSPIP